MVRQIHYPVTRLQIILEQLAEEKNQHVIAAIANVLGTGTRFSANNFLPIEGKEKFNKEVAAFFFKKATFEKENKDMQIFCIDNAVPFATDKDQLEQAADWIKTGKINIGGEELACELTVQHKCCLIKNCTASPHFTSE